MMTHIAESRLHDYMDDAVEPNARGALDAHLSTCGECAAQLRSLRELRAALHALPGSIEPATDLLPGIRARLHGHPASIEHGVRIHGAAATSVRERRPRWPLLAAAAVILCALSSAVTFVVMRNNAEQPVLSTLPATVGEAQLVALRATEVRYQDAIAELRSALLREQGVLEPETVRLLEQSLTTIDRALAEARVALAADPANGVLAEMLHANYEKKLDLLRRASAHARVRS